MNTILPTITPACPAWCSLKPGHSWESVVDVPGTNGFVQRWHGLSVARCSIPGVEEAVVVTIEASEAAPATLQDEEIPDGRGITGRPRLAVHWPDEPSTLAVDEADAFARELSAAIQHGAAALRELQG